MKLQVLVSDEIVSRIDKLAEYIGTSRSSLCATIICKSLPEWESSYPSNEEFEQLEIQE